MSVLSVGELVVSYGPIRALKGLDVEVGEKELVAIIGPNGAGKSTLMRALSGLMLPRSGTITLDGEDITRMSSYRRFAKGLVQVAEGRAILQRMTVEENLKIAVENGRDPRSSGEIFAELYERFAILKERRAAFAGTLSGGEQQMLAIARALAARPRLLLLDEPSLGLAPLMIRQVFDIIDDLRRQGTAMLLVEQNVREALRIADRGYVLELGRVIASGAASELGQRSEVLRAYLGHQAAPVLPKPEQEERQE